MKKKTKKLKQNVSILRKELKMIRRLALGQTGDLSDDRVRKLVARSIEYALKDVP